MNETDDHDHHVQPALLNPNPRGRTREGTDGHVDLVMDLSWEAVLESRTCPPAPRLLDSKASRHLATCERCRERARGEDVAPPVFGRSSNQKEPQTAPAPGEVWLLKSEQEGWKEDGRYVPSASVFILGIDGAQATVAMVYDDPVFAATGDFELAPPQSGFVEAWNTFIVWTRELDVRWIDADATLLQRVNSWRLLHGRRSLHGGANAAFLEKFRSLELTVAADLTANCPESAASYDVALRRIVEEVDWESLTLRLLCYARTRLRSRGFQPERMAADYVRDAVTLMLGGCRSFPENRKMTVFRFLCGVVDSAIQADAERAAGDGTDEAQPASSTLPH